MLVLVLVSIRARHGTLVLVAVVFVLFIVVVVGSRLTRVGACHARVGVCHGRLGGRLLVLVTVLWCSICLYSCSTWSLLWVLSSLTCIAVGHTRYCLVLDLLVFVLDMVIAVDASLDHLCCCSSH